MGGKQLLVPHLLPMIPEHSTYVEVFGGATARRLLYRVYRSRHSYDVLTNFLEEANAIVNEFIFIAYLAGNGRPVHNIMYLGA
jgi:site-specific DNA-adenine methylase